MGEVPQGVAAAALGQWVAIVTVQPGVNAHSVTYKYNFAYVLKSWAIYSLKNTVTLVYLGLCSESSRGLNIFFLLSNATTNCCQK